MLNRDLTLSSSQESELRTALRELQEEAILLVLPGLYTAGAFLILFSSSFRTSIEGAIPGILLVGLTPLIWGLRRVNYMLAVGTLVIGVLLIVCILFYSVDIVMAVSLLALPVGLLTLFAGVVAGLIGAAVGTLAIVLLPLDIVPLSPTDKGIALLQLWGTFWLVWMTLRSLLTAMIWYRDSYEQSRSLLDEARNHQLHLSETLEDLADANVQLSRLHRMANSMRRLAEEARHAKEEFVANVSHELRTPLNMIIGFTEMIMQAPQTYGPNVPQSLLADLDIVRRNSQHLSTLIDDVLDLSQLDTGHMALSKDWVDIGDIIEAAVIAVQPLYESKGLTLHINISQDLPRLNCDPVRIRQVLLNLLSNAGRFTDEGGVQVDAKYEAGSVTLCVSDSGPGITRGDLEEIFQPFQQLDGSIRRQYDGSGLGLSISKGFVELHGGVMWVESEVGAGTSFFFRLPVDAAIETEDDAIRWLLPYSPYHERTRPSQAPRQPVLPRIVVLETGHSLQRLVSRYMDNSQIVQVESVERALVEIASQPCHALLINDMDVPEQLRQLETNAIPFGLPVIICSVPGTVESADRLGVADYLVKPVARGDLLRVLAPLCDNGSTILVVDDDREALRLFRRMLASAGRNYRVIRASDGEKALQLMRRERPNAVLVDLIMPGVDGFQFIATKNQDDEMRDIPVVVLSAQDPVGQPIVCKAVAATRGGGISARRLLASVEAMIQILTPQRANLHVEGIEKGIAGDGFTDEASSAESESQLLLGQDGGDDHGRVTK